MSSYKPPSGPITDAQTIEERYLRHILVRDQMTQFVREPLMMSRADGVYYWDVNDKRYLDALSGIYVVNVGHNNRRIIEAIQRQMDTLSYSPVMHGTNPEAVKLANRLAELAPADLNVVKLFTGGAEATEGAIKMARQYHKLRHKAGKYKIISRYQSWHGSTLGSLSASGLASRRTGTEPLAPGFVHVFPPTCYRCPFGKEYPSCEITCASLIGDVIEQEGAETVAALLVEPIGHTGGVIDPPPEYLPMLRELCDRYDILLIFDEIINGMGRTGELFAAQTFGIIPDLLCLGKGLSGGYAPLAALVCRQPVADVFWGDVKSNPGFIEGHTYEGNPISSAAGLATLNEILQRDLCANARRMGEHLRSGLQSLSRHGIVGDIRGKGLFLGVEWVRNIETKARFNPPIGQMIGTKALANGLLTRFDPHWMALGPPLTINKDQIDQIVALLDQSISEALSEWHAAL